MTTSFFTDLIDIFKQYFLIIFSYFNFKELIGSTSQEAAGLGDVAIEVLHLLLAYLLNKNQEESIVPEDQLKSFLNSLRKDFPWERVPAVLAPLLYPVKQVQETTALNFEVGNKIKIEMVSMTYFYILMYIYT